MRFLRYLLVGVTAVALAFAGTVSLAENLPSYTVVVLGDVHFDGPETNTYHSVTNNWKPNRLKEFKRNIGMWKKYMPGLLDSAGRAAKENNAKFVFQLGDIVQGDCPDGNTHGQMVSNAFSVIKKRFPDTPLLPTMGNHDLRSPNGRKAYIDTMTPLLTRELDHETKAPNYVVHQGPDVFIFADFNAPNISFIKKALEESDGTRYVFVVSHGLLMPDKDSDWFLFGRGSKPEVREEMRKLFAKHHVIGISGHVHRTEYLDLEIDGGRISQLVVSSVRIDTSVDEIEPSFGAVEDYGLGKYRDGKFPKIMRPYVSGIKSYFSTKAAGFVVLKIDDSGVIAEFHPGESNEAGKVIKVR